MNNDLISRKELIEILEPFLDEHCSEYIKEMVIAKIKFMMPIEMPEKIEMNGRLAASDIKWRSYWLGWNDCIDEILEGIDDGN